MRALRHLLTVAVTSLLTSWALAQPPTVDDLDAGRRAAVGMLLTIVLGLAVIIILLRLLGGREQRHQQEHPEDTP